MTTSMPPGATERQRAALAQLDAVESEMRRIGYWAVDTGWMQAKLAAGEVRSFLDAPFELWLQCVFLPNARDAARGDTMPQRSQVGLMAMRQYDYHTHVLEAQPLVRLLSEFDAIVEGRDPREG